MRRTPSGFHREAQAIAALNHTSIAAIYDLAEADGIIVQVTTPPTFCPAGADDSSWT